MLSKLPIGRILGSIFIILVVAFGLISAANYPKVQIPVLAVRVDSGTLITADKVVYRPWQANATDGLVIDARDLVGKVTAVPVEPNTPLTPAMLLGAGSKPQVTSRFPFANADDADKLKLYVPVTFNQTGGMIQPGDYVDLVYVAKTGEARVLFEKIHVVAERAAGGVDIAPQVLEPGQAPAVLPAGLVLSLSKDQLLALAPIDWQSLLFLYTTADAKPLGTDIPTGVPSASAAGAPVAP